MAQMIKIDPAQLERFESDKTYVTSLLPFRGVHTPYRDIAVQMAAAFKEAKKLFANVAAKRGEVSEDQWRQLEREAGEKAQVWLVPIRNHRVGPSIEEMRSLLRQELARFFPGIAPAA